MALYKYRAIGGDKKTIRGLVEAASEDSVVEILEDKGLAIVSIELQSADAGFKGVNVLNRVRAKDLVIFSRQFSVLISANVAIVQSLKIMVEQTDNVKLKIIISEVADEVDSGSRLSEALSKRSNIFSSFYVSVVRSGETSGKLDNVLNYLADEMEKDYDMTSKIKGAMIYPAIVLIGLSIVGAVMMIVVIPKLTSIFTETGAELPLPTKILMGASDFMSRYWWIMLASLVGAGAGFRSFIRTARGRAWYDYFKLKLPVFGHLFHRIYLVRFTRSMHTLLVGGVTITESLKISSDVVSNTTYKGLILDTITEVERGNSISKVFKDSPVIPKMVSEMMAVGEKTGKMDIVLERITSFYTREIDNIVNNLMTLMEPVIMIIMGGAVGIMVAAIILPMYNMASQF